MKLFFFFLWIFFYLFSEEGRRLAEDLIAELARCQVAKCLSTSKARDQYSPPPSPAPVPAAPRGSQAAPAKVALVGGTQYFFPNSLSICSLFSEVKGGWVSTRGQKETFLFSFLFFFFLLLTLVTHFCVRLQRERERESHAWRLGQIRTFFFSNHDLKCKKTKTKTKTKTKKQCDTLNPFKLTGVLPRSLHP